MGRKISNNKGIQMIEVTCEHCKHYVDGVCGIKNASKLGGRKRKCKEFVEKVKHEKGN